jgi:phage gpG-like protein
MPSGGFSISITKDDLSASVLGMANLTRNPTPILRAIGTELISLTKRSFRDSSLRSIAWPAKSDGSTATLIRKGLLLSSIRITALSADGVTIGSDRVYAAIHQLGGVIVPTKAKSLVFTIGGKTIFAKKVTIPARPYFPFLPNGQLAPLAAEPVRKIGEAALDAAARGSSGSR